MTGWRDWAGTTGGPRGRSGCGEKVRREASVGGGGGVLSRTGTSECNSLTADHAVGIAPAVIPTPAGVRFSAVAEVHASASDVDDDILVVKSSEQPIVCSTDSGRAPRVGSVPTTGTFVSESLEHSVERIDLDGRPTEGVVILEPLEHSVPDISLDGRPMAGRLDPEPLEHSVSQEDQTGGLIEGEFGPEPLEHSVPDVHLDSRPRQGELNSGPSEHSVPDRAPRRSH